MISLNMIGVEIQKDSGINQNDTIRLIGTWEWSDEIQEWKFIFYENASFYSYYINHAINETHKGFGNYELKDNKLYLSTSHGYEGKPDSAIYDYEFSDNNTKVTFSSIGRSTMILTKVS